MQLYKFRFQNNTRSKSCKPRTSTSTHDFSSADPTASLFKLVIFNKIKAPTELGFKCTKDYALVTQDATLERLCITLKCILG
jgi:hypothetical protein